MEFLDCAYGYILGYDTGCDLADCSEDGSRAISGSDTPTESASTMDTNTPGFMGGSKPPPTPHPQRTLLLPESVTAPTPTPNTSSQPTQPPGSFPTPVSPPLRRRRGAPPKNWLV